MSLLKLAPDSERLRRIARAYAAGEVEENEYRRIRAEVIDGFLPDTHLGDDTQQRWSPPAPLPSEPTPSDTQATAVDGSAPMSRATWRIKSHHRATARVKRGRSARVGAALFVVTALIAVAWLL